MYRSCKLPYIALLAIYFLINGTLAGQSESDLVEIQSVDPTIQVELKYAAADNLTGKVLYPPEFKAQLRRGVLNELIQAQRSLESLGYGLKVWDAYRPMDAQKELFFVNSDPRFVALPGLQSMHNRGAAVDVTLVDKNGKEVPMPTKFDVMDSSAFYIYRGKDPVILKNLQTLQKVMKQSGFFACRTEWWHFFSRQWEKYPNVPEPERPSAINPQKSDQP